MAGRRKRGPGICIYIIPAALIIFLAVLIVQSGWLSALRGSRIETKAHTFTESSRELMNPNRGFYRLYSFRITDKKKDYKKLLAQINENDTDTKLMFAQICLEDYCGGEITKKGLANIDTLLDVLEMTDKQLIIRFVYDRDGENEENEPEELEIILRHMEQLEDILKGHARKIFLLQGLFVGNWGEMNGTRYDSDEEFRTLAGKLADVTDESTYLSVRIPAQWRTIMESKAPIRKASSGSLSAERLGLFNDGMLGNEGDYGTYRTEEDRDAPGIRYPRWERGEEIAFQNELCRFVPNGGEVINENPYNDFDNAIKDMAAMHITYLNKVYDASVMNKWKQESVKEKGCFYGMDGLSYVERHLGYRLVVERSFFEKDVQKQCLTAGVKIKNVGFAPLYKEAKIRIILHNEADGEVRAYPVSQTLYDLPGGDEAEKTTTLYADIPFRELTGEEYTVYLSIIDSGTGEHILLANEEDEGQYGYDIGTIRTK